jgi:transcription elongation factor Elf1
VHTSAPRPPANDRKGLGRARESDEGISRMSNPETRKNAPTSYACPACGMAMRIALVEPHGEEEKRTFECTACKQSKTVLVKYG